MRFTLPRNLYHGKDALEALKTLAGKEAVVVAGGGSMKQFGSLDKVVNHLKGAGMEIQLSEGVGPDPSVGIALKGAIAMQKFEPDWIVAVDGGSPIDAAKAMWAFYKHPDTPFEGPITSLSFPALHTRVGSCAIFSTSGTTAEVTAFSAITDHKKGIKYPLVDLSITPDVAIVDPALTEIILKRLTAHTGVDATAHTIGTYVSTLHCECIDPLALHAIEMIDEYPIPSYNGNMEAHDKMHDAQCLAGTVFSNALPGIVYSMVHRAGATYSGGHIVHGCANAMYPPKVIKLSSKESEAVARYAKIAKLINLPGTTDEELTDALIARLLGTNKALDILVYIKDYEGGIIDEKESMDKSPKAAELVVSDACIGSNPGIIILEVVEQLLKCCYYDREIDF